MDRRGLLWIVVGRCGSLWDRCGSLWIVVDRCGSFRVLVTTPLIMVASKYFSPARLQHNINVVDHL